MPAELLTFTSQQGTGFAESEKDRLGIRGLVPPRVFPMEMQLQRIMLNLNQCRDNLEKYVFLSALSDRNLTAFYKVRFQPPMQPKFSLF